MYSLGCVLYEMLTGQVAYPKDSDMAKLWAHVTDPPPLPRTQRPELVGAFDEVVARATAKEPEDRYATAGEMAGALQAATALQDAAVAGPELGAGAAQFATRGETLGERSVFPDAPPLPPAGEAVHEAEGRFTPEPPAASGARPPSGAAVAQSGRGGQPPDPPPDRPGRGGRGGGGGGGGRPGRRGSGAGGGWISRHRGLLAGGLALIVAAIAAVVLLGNNSSDNTPAPAPERGQPVSAKLGPIPTNRVHGDGSAVMRLDGKKLKVTITTGGLLDGAPHAMHLHGGKRGLCPPSSVAGPHNGHISIATHAGVPYYGPVVQSLTTKGDVSPKSFLAFARYPNTGAIHYTRTIKVSGVVASEIRQRNAVLVVHGIDYNGNGLYDGTLDRSELDRSLTGESTAPALCGPLVPGKQAARSKKTAEVPPGSGGGETFTATFAPERQPAVRGSARSGSGGPWQPRRLRAAATPWLPAGARRSPWRSPRRWPASSSSSRSWGRRVRRSTAPVPRRPRRRCAWPTPGSAHPRRPAGADALPLPRGQAPPQHVLRRMRTGLAARGRPWAAARRARHRAREAHDDPAPGRGPPARLPRHPLYTTTADTRPGQTEGQAFSGRGSSCPPRAT